MNRTEFTIEAAKSREQDVRRARQIQQLGHLEVIELPDGSQDTT
ncbi:hypothetical protein [Rathayibacter agropyri]|nr:hypothetical protein [Rathayibacter agropyri]